MTDLTRRDALTGAGLILLAGCGGGGSSPAPAPTPSPTPTPTPTPGPSPVLGNPSFGTLGVTTAQAFTTLAHSYRAAEGGWLVVPNRTTFNFAPDFSFRLVPPNDLFLRIATIGEGRLIFNGSGGTSGGVVTEAGFHVLGGSITLRRPGVEGSLLDYTMEAYFSRFEAVTPDPYFVLGFAYGLTTAPNAAPAAGIASYVTSWGGTLQIDFSARTVSGAIRAAFYGPTTTYTLRDTVLNAERTRFSGWLVPGDGAPDSPFEAILTGPTGQEFAARVILRSNSAEPDYIDLISGKRTA
jgi:hypothetical protein